MVVTDVQGLVGYTDDHRLEVTGYLAPLRAWTSWEAWEAHGLYGIITCLKTLVFNSDILYNSIQIVRCMFFQNLLVYS